jgi:excisionase family DNA binding protein
LKASGIVRKVRTTGIGVIGGVAWGTHICQFYRTRKDLIEVLVPYFKAGLEHNELCIWVTSRPLGVRGATAALRKAVGNLDDYLSRGQIKVLGDRTWYAEGGKFDGDGALSRWLEREKLAVSEGFDGLRVSGNVFRLGRKDWRGLTDYETAIDSVIGGHRIIAICTYPLDRCKPAELVDVVSSHRLVLIRQPRRWRAIENARRRRSGLIRHRATGKRAVTRQGKAKKTRPRLLTTSETAELLNVHMNTVRRWSDKGALQAYRIGSRGDRRFQREDLNNFLRRKASLSM